MYPMDDPRPGRLHEQVHFLGRRDRDHALVRVVKTRGDDEVDPALGLQVPLPDVGHLEDLNLLHVLHLVQLRGGILRDTVLAGSKLLTRDGRENVSHYRAGFAFPSSVLMADFNGDWDGTRVGGVCRIPCNQAPRFANLSMSLKSNSPLAPHPFAPAGISGRNCSYSSKHSAASSLGG
jgi:hypothetical protein